MRRRADVPMSESGKAVWKALEKIEHRGHSRADVFRDWLDLLLETYLSTSEHIHSGGTDLAKPETFFERDNRHETAYMAIVDRYKDNQSKGARAIDYFAEASTAALLGIYKDDADPFGDVYMSAISFGEHGQFFTPRHIADAMAAMACAELEDGQIVADPSGCGSGIMLLAAAKINPRARFVGIDLDERCAKMCALNLISRELSGTVYCGNSLSGEMYTQWNIKDGWVWRIDKPERLDLKLETPKTDNRGQLTLL